MVQGPTGPHSSGPPADGPPNEPKESKALSFREQAVQSILESLRNKRQTTPIIRSIQQTGNLTKAEAIKIVREVTQEIAKKHPTKKNLKEENQEIASIMYEMDFDVEDVKDAIEVDDPSRESIFIEKAALERRKTNKPLDKAFEGYGVVKGGWLEYPWKALKAIQNLISGKKDQQTLIEMSMRSAKIDGRKTSETIQYAGIEGSTKKGQRALIEIAKAAAKQNGRGTVFNFKNYGIDWRTPEAQKALLEIAEIIAEHDAVWLVVYRENLGINWETPEAQKLLIKILMNAAEQDPLWMAQNIQNIEIDESTKEGQDALINILMIIVQLDPQNVGQHFHNFKINWKTPEAQKVLIEILKIIAQKDPVWTAQNIQNIEIDESTKEGQDALLEILKTVIESYSSKVAPHFYNFKINWKTPEAQKVLIEILNNIAARNGEWLAQNIQNIELDWKTTEGQTALTEIIRIIATFAPYYLDDFINNLRIDWKSPEGTKFLMEILKNRDIYTSSHLDVFINNLGIDWKTTEGQKFLIKILMIIAKENGEWLAQNIQNIELDRTTSKGQKALIEILKIVIQSNDKCVVEDIHNFGIDWRTPEAQKALIEAVKIIARSSSNLAAAFIRNIGIDWKTPEGAKFLIEILKITAEQTDWDFIRLILELKIDWKTPGGTEFLIKILKIAAELNHWGLIPYIQQLNIDWRTQEAQKGLIEVFKIAAQHINDEKIKEIFNYGIGIKKIGIDGSTEQGQRGLTDIAKILAQKAGYGLSRNIKEIGIDETTEGGQGDLIEIFKMALLKHGWIVCCEIQKFGITDKNKRASLLLFALENDPGSIFSADLFELGFPNFNMEILHSSDPSELKEYCKPFISKLPSLAKEIDSITDARSMRVVKEKATLAAAIFLTCEIKGFPFEGVIEQVNELSHLRNPSLRSNLGEIVISQLVKVQNINDLKSFSNLHKELSPLTSSCLWSLQQQGADPKAIDELAHVIQKNKNLFKDTFAEQKLFKAMYTLIKDDTLSINNKLEILQFAFKRDDKKNILRLLRGVSSIYFLSGNLKSLEDVRSEESFSQVYLEAFQSVIPVADIQDFSKKFERTFEEFRDTTALFTYAATLNKLPEQEKAPLLEKLAVFVSEVLEGTLSASRYETEHLNNIFATDTALKEKWTKGAVAPFAPAEEESGAPKLPDFKNLVETSLREGHHGDVELPFLQGEKTQQELIEASKNKDLSKEERDLLNFQKHLINLTKATDSKHALAILDLCLKHLPDKIKGTQLARDIQGWRNGLAEQSTISDFEGWTIVDSDDPCDLLLCGTEVEDSCQRVDGDPKYNKCLLAYLLDGKNRVITIKNERGVIKARSFLRLLFDGEKPVLFLERAYPSVLDDKKRNGLIEFAKSRAKDIGLPLFSKEIKSGDIYRKLISSLGGPAPFEYVDASNGVHANSVWSIFEAHVLE